MSQAIVNLTEKYRSDLIGSDSSSGWGGSYTYVYDGIHNTSKWNHTRKSSYEFVELIFPNPVSITQVQILNRGNCCGNRLNGARLNILDSSGVSVFSSAPIANARNGTWHNFNIPESVQAQHVRLEHSNQYLHISEMVVRGYDTHTTTGGGDGNNTFNFPEIEPAQATELVQAAALVLATAWIFVQLRKVIK